MLKRLRTSGAERKAKLKAGVEAMHRRYPGVFARLADELDDIALHCASLPVLDPRPADEIVGYDEDGLPRKS